MKEDFLKQIDSHMGYVYTIAVKMLGKEDAEDAAQEAIIRAYRNIDNFRNEAKLSTWLYRITINICKDMLRKKHVELSLEEIPEPEGGTDPLKELERKELVQLVDRCMADLRVDYREILILKYTLGYEYEEIAAELGIPVGTVKSRLNRAKKSLRSLMERRRNNE